MRRHTLDDLLRRGVSYDVETWLTEPGLLAPPLVCASAGWADLPEHGDRYVGQLLDKADAVQLFCELMDDREKVVAGANIAFDTLVIAKRLAEYHGVDAMPEIFAALMDDQRVFDVQIAQQLDAIAEGCLGKDPRTGGPLMSPEDGRRAGYSLSVVTDLVLGRKDAKVNDEWRLRYRELDGIPIHLWPENARTYPVDDARNTIEDALAQVGLAPRAGAHRWGAATECEWCGVHPADAYKDGEYVPCRAPRRARNLHDLSNQVGTAWAMHLGAAHGFRVNQASVDLLRDDALDGRTDAEEPFVQAGLLRRNRDGSTTKDLGSIRRAVALAYGADPAKPCPTCAGSRKVVSSKAKPVKCPMCRGGADSAAWVVACPKCQGAKTIPDPKQLINCPDCCATGIDLETAPHIPRTPKDGISYGRDVLNESGSEQLMSLADHQEDAKVLEVYVPYLRRARAPVAGHGEACPAKMDASNECSCPGPYKDIPLTLWPNVLLETGRTSYRGVIQLFPRAPGHWVKEGPRKGKWVPSIRECIEARDGWVFSSEDYEAGELVTHAQSCLWICGESKLAEALIGGLKVHNLLGASMIGMAYDEFMRRVKETACKDARQAAKPGNFGFPGGMGAVKLVLQQRKGGPDTPHQSGPAMIRDDAGNPVRGYKGLRFCILMDGAPRCGGEGNMVTEWPPRSQNGRGREPQPIPPTCRRCIECAMRLKDAWLSQWPENETYFKYINDCIDNGQMIDSDFLDMWPWLKDFFVPNKRLAPGEIMQHVSGRVRGGLDYCACSNGFFQGLLADIAKSALRRMTRECYDRTVRIDLPHENSKKSAYAGGPSPLFGHRPIVFAHDEIILEHPESEAHEGAMRVSEIMVEEMMFYCPDLAPACAAEPTLMRKWFKSASQRWRDGGDKRKDANDRLVPWTPKQ